MPGFIQEPIAFGLPIVLNPILLIPHILAPLANTVVGWLAISAGIVPIFKYVVPWTMPLFFGATIGTGSIAGGLLQVVWLLMDICIYAPFVRVTGSDVSNAAAIIGNAAFLFPETRCVPATTRFPLMIKLPTRSPFQHTSSSFLLHNSKF